ncbi:MAG: T9SS type A sorting domain-containing protein [Ignavibacterium sp.]
MLQIQAQEIKERSIKEILNEDGTIRKGVEGSFNAQGFEMYYGKNGEPIFLPKIQKVTGRQWYPLGIGTNNGVSGNVTPISVSSIAVLGDNVFVGGNFTKAGVVDANYVARYNLSTDTWSSLGTGISNGAAIPKIFSIVLAGNNLIVGGQFNQAGSVQVNNIARYDLATETWHSLGTGSNNGTFGEVYALAASENSVFVGGAFIFAGGQPIRYLARYDLATDSWSSLSAGTNNAVGGIVHALAVSGNKLFVGGIFTEAGGSTANKVAQCDLTSGAWSSLGTGTSNGVGGTVRALAVSGNNVFVGGDFTDAGGQTANRVARYDLTTGTWSPLGSGTSNGVSGGTVRALAVSGNSIFVAGDFGLAGGQTANHVARYDLGSGVWNVLAADFGTNNGVNNNCYSLLISGDNLFIGGWFVLTGGYQANRIVRYTETTTNVNENGSLPASFRLMQNYPNPFNPSTTISFTIPYSEFVALKVYDVLGNEVATIVNENLTAGTHSYNFDASNLTSGVYFYKLQAGNYKEVKKMLLTK